MLYAGMNIYGYYIMHICISTVLNSTVLVLLKNVYLYQISCLSGHDIFWKYNTCESIKLEYILRQLSYCENLIQLQQDYRDLNTISQSSKVFEV